MIQGPGKRCFSTIWVTYFATPSPGPPIFAQTSSGSYTQGTTFQFLVSVFQLPTTFLMPFAIARHPKGTHGELIGAERAQWNPKSGPEGAKKESLGAKICFIYGANVVKKGACGCQVSKPSQKRLPCIQCAGHWWADEGRSGTLVWRAANCRH